MSKKKQTKAELQARIDQLENWCMVYDICITCGGTIGSPDCECDVVAEAKP